jgi:hypothetical protein
VDAHWRLRHQELDACSPATVLSGLIVASSIAAGRPILEVWDQGLGCSTAGSSAGHDAVIGRVATALRPGLAQIIQKNLLVTWARMLGSGISSLVVPVRYTVTSASNTLDCLFHVPVVPREDDGTAGARVCRLAALQVHPVLSPAHQSLELLQPLY